MQLTFADNKTERPAAIIEKVEQITHIGKIDIPPSFHGFIRDRMCLWFPLLVDPEWKGTLAYNWLKVYPRVIQFTDGKYYVFTGTHSGIPEYNIKGDNTVHYKEILVEQGEKIEYQTYGS
jgi:hypothetical protein